MAGYDNRNRNPRSSWHRAEALIAGKPENHMPKMLAHKAQPERALSLRPDRDGRCPLELSSLRLARRRMV